MKEDIKQEVIEIANGDVLGDIDNTPDTKPLPKKRGRKPKAD